MGVQASEQGTAVGGGYAEQEVQERGQGTVVGQWTVVEGEFAEQEVQENLDVHHREIAISQRTHTKLPIGKRWAGVNASSALV